MLKADEVALANGCYFDEEAADRVVEFFRRFLRHSKGQFAGKRFEPLPWQKDHILRPLFGWRRADGTRRFRRAYIEVPKKNGKSTLCAGLALYLLIGDGEPGSEVYSAASDRDQASIVFQEAVHMVESSPALLARLEIVRSSKRIVHNRSRSLYKALSADVATKEGLNIHGLIFDELHAQPNRKLWDTLKYGGAARRQPLFVSITTAGFDRTSICWEQHVKAKGILDGTTEDDAFFAFIACADEKDDWKSPETWRKANPSYGDVLTADSFLDDFKDADGSPMKEAVFKRYRLNVWTDAEVQWIPMDKWDACDGVVDASQLAGAECFGGLDLCSTTDLSAFVLFFPKQRAVLPFFWCPSAALDQRAKQAKERLEPWIRRKLITETEGNAVHYDLIRKKINDLNKVYEIKGIAVDRWNSTQVQCQLADDGFHIEPWGQGFSSMTAPAKELERQVLEGELRHGGHDVLRWMASLCVAKMDPAGNIKLDKSKSKDKIDGIVALVMAMGHWMQTIENTFDGKLTIL